VPIGTLLGLAMGGLIADAYGWRAAFMVASAPGLVLALVIALTVRETRPSKPFGAETLRRSLVLPFVDLVDTVKALASKPTFWFVAIGCGFSAFVGYAQLFFTASFFLRCHAPEVAAIAAGFGLKSKGFLGPALGVMTALGGLTGTLVGGQIADRAVGRDRRAFMSVPALAALASIPFVFVLFTLKSTWGALALDFVPNVVATIWYGAGYRPERGRAASTVDGGGAAAADPQPDRAGPWPDLPRRLQRFPGQQRAPGIRRGPALGDDRHELLRRGRGGLFLDGPAHHPRRCGELRWRV